MREIISQRGFLLMDTLIAMTILALGLTSLIRLQVQVLDLNGRSKSRAEALRLAEDRFENLRYRALQTQSADGREQGDESRSGANTEFQLRWTTADHPDPDYRLLTVTVSWESAEQTRNITIGGPVAAIQTLPDRLFSRSGSF